MNVISLCYFESDVQIEMEIGPRISALTDFKNSIVPNLGLPTVFSSTERTFPHVPFRPVTTNTTKSWRPSLTISLKEERKYPSAINVASGVAECAGCILISDCLEGNALISSTIDFVDLVFIGGAPHLQVVTIIIQIEFFYFQEARQLW